MLWKSPRPQSMVLERSSDRGLTWEAYRYYSSSCVTVFGLDPPVIFPGITGTEAICTQTESAVIPSTNGEVRLTAPDYHIFTQKGRKEQIQISIKKLFVQKNLFADKQRNPYLLICS